MPGTESDSAPRLFTACEPRTTGSTNDNYAADLHRAIRDDLGTIEKAREFFRSTYPTQGLTETCRMIFRRLSKGDESNEPSLYRLDSRFGGGKTHTLVALAALAQHPELLGDEATPFASELRPDGPVRLVAFTGENTDLVNGAALPDFPGVRPKSLIGHIALQLGGMEAFERFATHDDDLTSPGSGEIEQLLGKGPCLILIDELVAMLRRYQGTLYQGKLPQFTALMSALAKAVENSPMAVMVVTTPEESHDAFRDATLFLTDTLRETDSVLSRTMHQVITSSADGSDLPHILRRRLFTHISDEAREQVARAYAEMLRRSGAHIAPLPQGVDAYAWIHESYPFHPDTLSLITNRLAANENFQRTRGTLRLLSRTVQHLRGKKEEPAPLLIHPHHVDPEDEGINGELLSRLEKGEFAAAVLADILNPASTANLLDETRPTYPGRRIARTVLLASLGPVASSQGFSAAEIVRAVATPEDDDLSVISNAVTEFRNKALYVNDDPQDPAIRFTTVPSLNRILGERAGRFSSSDVRDRIRSTLAECFAKPSNSLDHMEASVFPSPPDIPDSQDTVHLGVLNYEWMTAEGEGLVEALGRFYQQSPANNGQAPREYRNKFAVLVADADSPSELDTLTRRLLAAQDVKDNPPEMLQDHQKARLENELASAKQDLFIKLQQRYVHLYYPSTEDPIAPGALLTHIRITRDDAVEKPGSGQHAVLKTLRARSKLLGRDNAHLNGALYWEQRQNLIDAKVKLTDIRDEFAREPGNYMLLNHAAATKLFGNALDDETLTIQSGAGLIIKSSQDLRDANDAGAYVYLRKHACPECNRFRSDCPGHDAPLPAPCPQCGRPQHEGECEQAPPPDPTGIPPFTMRGDEAMNVLAARLREHMREQNVGVGAIDSLTLYGNGASFVNYLASLAGQSASATVTYSLRGSNFELSISGMAIGEWGNVLGQISPLLEGMKGAEVNDCTMVFDGQRAQGGEVEKLLSQFPASRKAAMEVTFRQEQETP